MGHFVMKHDRIYIVDQVFRSHYYVKICTFEINFKLGSFDEFEKMSPTPFHCDNIF